MSGEPYVVIEKKGKVFDSNDGRLYWVSSDSVPGGAVGPEAGPLVEIIASGYCLLPRIPARAGVYNVFTLERKKRTTTTVPSRLRDVCLFVDGLEGVYASLVYDAAVLSFAAGMNAGSGERELRGFFLKSKRPEEDIAGRVLQFLVLVRHDVLYAGVEAVWDAPEISAFGQGGATGSLFRPWRAPPEGEWVATSGEVPGTSFLPFPPGFELADVRVTLSSRPQDVDNLPFRSGGLDYKQGSESSLLIPSHADSEEWTYGF